MPAATGDSLLLVTLRDVSDLVSNSHELKETIENIVALIQDRFHTDVCSLYLFDRKSKMLVLRATRGLKPECVDQLQLSPNEGLVGLTFERRDPVNVSNASEHPRYRYFPESGEEEFPTFLGVPLVAAGLVHGVLVIQRRDRTPYSTNMVSLMMGVAAQLGTLVANAQLTKELSDSLSQTKKIDADRRPRTGELHGVPACPGFGSGKAVRFEPFDFSDPNLVSRAPGTVAEELARLERAIENGRRDLQTASEHIAELLGEEFGALMQAQRVLLEDKAVRRQLRQAVENGASVEQAVVRVGSDYLRAFERLDNPMFYERIYDIKDVFRRVLEWAAPNPQGISGNDPIVVVAHEVSLLELFASDIARVKAIVVEKGGSYSHVAILARSLGIPMLTQTPRILKSLEDGDLLFVDANVGVVTFNPDEQRRRVLESLLAPRLDGDAAEIPAEPVPIKLEATVNLLPEVARSVENAAEGIGLYRSEFLQLARRTVPSEEEQFDVYRRMAVLLNGRPLTVRTFDLRSDKLFRVVEDLPRDIVWEWRLVDESPHVQELIRIQIRAILRASEAGPIRILFPMIATEKQLRCALRLVDEAKRSLRSDGLRFDEHTKIGFMIEVPAAVMMVKRWVDAVDFLGIGSNDLLHSLLGIDRESDVLARLKTPLEPTYLRAVRHVVKQGRQAHRPVTVCGEAASFPRAALALAALGVTSISVPPNHIPKVRREFASVCHPQNWDSVGRQLASAADITDVERILDRAFPVRKAE